uniref:NUFIP1 domain-containing protein n=1 Tax=Strongyloides papillosus TaxID=174720 RepID=A0A0N5C8Z5_STREA
MTDNNGLTTNNNFNNMSSDSSKYNMDNSMGSFYPNQQYNQFNSQPNNQFSVPNGQNNYINSQMFSNQNNSNQNDNMSNTQLINQSRSVYDMSINKQSSYPQQSPTPNSANNMNNYSSNMNLPINNNNTMHQHSQIYSNMSFVFSSDMANKAICEINEKKYDNFKSWHISNYGHPNQFSNDKKLEQNCSRGVKRKMSPIKEQPNSSFTKPLSIPSTNGIHGQDGSGNILQNNTYGNLSTSSRTYNKDDDNPLRRMERMTQETLNEPPNKIPIRGNNPPLNGDNSLSYDQKKSQEKHLKLEKLNQIEKVFGIDKTRQKEESYHMNHMLHEQDMNKFPQGPMKNPNGFMQGVPMNIQQGMHQNIPQNMRQNGPPNLGPPFLPNTNMPPQNRPGSQPMPGNQRSHPQQQSPSVPFFPPGQNLQNRMNQFPNQQQLQNPSQSNPMMPSPQMYPMGSGGQQQPKQFIPPSSLPQQNNMRQMPMNGMQQPNMPPNINQSINPNMTQMRQQNMSTNINPNVNQVSMPNGIPNHSLQQKMPVPNNMNVINGQNNRPQNLQNPGMTGSGMQIPGLQGPGLQSPNIQNNNLQNSGIQGPGIPQQNRPQQNMPPPNMQLPNSMGSMQKSQQQQNMDQMMIQQNQNNQRFLPNQQIPNQMINGQNGMVPQGNEQSNMMRPNYDMSMIPSF